MATIEQRALLLEKAQHDAQLQAELIELCKRDIIFWFETFCWTFDPRLPQPHLPFNLYPFQRQIVRALQFCIEEGKQKRDGNALIEKSRDMGLTWIVLLIFQYYWLFEEGSDFHVCSKKESSVDKKGVRAALFGKLRYNLNWLPIWMVPKLSRTQDSKLTLVHPANGNAITGEGATEDFGRGGRYKATLLDEFARHPNDEMAKTASDAVSNSNFYLFTPYGKANTAYRLASADDLVFVPLMAENTAEEIARTVSVF